jgi:hypothetical protein
MAIAQPPAAAPGPAREAGVGRAVVVAFLVAVSLAVALLDLYALWEFWPTAQILKTPSAQPVHLFGVDRHVAPEVRLLVVVALAGALGGVMHSTRSLAWYIGHGSFKYRWVPFYLATIVIGAGLASVFYLVIRGGLLAGKATTADTNPYGFAALGALVGLFTEQALEMLRRVAGQVFADAPQGADRPGAAGSPLGGAATLIAQTGAASNVTSTSATLAGSVTSADPETRYHFDYGTTIGYGETTPAQPLQAVGEAVQVSADVSGLVAGTAYHFRLVAVDASAAWTAGEDASFVTSDG